MKVTREELLAFMTVNVGLESLSTQELCDKFVQEVHELLDPETPGCGLASELLDYETEEMQERFANAIDYVRDGGELEITE